MQHEQHILRHDGSQVSDTSTVQHSMLHGKQPLPLYLPWIFSYSIHPAGGPGKQGIGIQPTAVRLLDEAACGDDGSLRRISMGVCWSYTGSYYEKREI